jgi:hypothetical protein
MRIFMTHIVFPSTTLIDKYLTSVRKVQMQTTTTVVLTKYYQRDKIRNVGQLESAAHKIGNSNTYKILITKPKREEPLRRAREN